MAWIFGDSFDLYAATADATAGYWDGGTLGFSFVSPGRFTGQCIANSSSSAWLFKNSGSNDAVHHLVFAYRQPAALTGSTLNLYFQLGDGATGQCCIVMRQDGAMLLTSGTPAGTVLATYTGALSVVNQWFAFEVEVVIHNTAGGFTVRRNGNTSADFQATALNTRGGTANNYASRLTIGQNASVANGGQIDDLLWRSDAASVPWVGDVRCYTRMPASDASAVFSRSPTSFFAQTTASVGFNGSASANNIRACSVTAPTTGTLASLSFNFNAGITGHAKMALYDNTGASGGPGALLASSVELTNPGAGVNTFTVAGGPAVQRGATYWVAIWSDVAIVGNGVNAQSIDLLALTYTTSFPSTMTGFTVTVQTGFGSNGMNVTPFNAGCVNEAQQDGATSYVYDSNVGDADFYGIAALSVTPASVIAVTTRGFLQKSDAGSRSGQVQLKSGGTTVGSTPAALSTTFGWMWRTDTVDPATSAAWTPTAVNNVTIGPKVTS